MQDLLTTISVHLVRGSVTFQVETSHDSLAVTTKTIFSMKGSVATAALLGLVTLPVARGHTLTDEANDLYETVSA